MKKWVKITIGVIGEIILLLVIDLVCIFTINRPLLAIQKNDKGSLNKVYNGILYNTHYCYEYEKPQIKSKLTKYTCPSDRITKLEDYDFAVVVDSHSKHKKTFIFEHNNINYYYGNTDFALYLKKDNSNYKYDIERALTKNLVKFSDILDKSIKVDAFWDGGSKLYHYHQFNIIVCNTIDGNNDVIIGDTEIMPAKLCK